MSFVFRFLLFVFCLVATTLAQSQTGDLFNFVPGLGACGYTNTSAEFVASVSADTFNSYPGAGANPNDNPICQHNITVTSGGKNVSAQIVDYFTQTGIDNDVGFSTAAFEQFADPSVGVVYNVTWVIV